jgi:hypothetical protein
MGCQEEKRTPPRAPRRRLRVQSRYRGESTSRCLSPFLCLTGRGGVGQSDLQPVWLLAPEPSNILPLIYPPGTCRLDPRRKRDASYFVPQKKLFLGGFPATCRSPYVAPGEEPAPPAATPPASPPPPLLRNAIPNAMTRPNDANDSTQLLQ